MKRYYILENIGSKLNDLPVGTRICCITSEKIFVKFDGEEGPYDSIAELRRTSSFFKKLLRTDPKRAQKIYDKKFIINVSKLIPIHPVVHEDLKGYIYKMLDHTLSGDIKGGKVAGVHYYLPKYHKVIQLIHPPNANGIWEAKIAVFNSNLNTWIEKEKSSTFFPENWDSYTLTIKLHEAFQVRERMLDTKYQGYTNCGIRITFIFKGSELLSLYPEYD